MALVLEQNDKIREIVDGKRVITKTRATCPCR